MYTISVKEIDSLSPVRRGEGLFRRKLYNITRRKNTEPQTTIHTHLPDKIFSGRLPLLWWKNPGWKEQYVVTTSGKAAATQAAATVVTGSVLTGSVLVGFNFPTNPVEAAAEVTGLVAGAITSVYLQRKSARQVM